VSERLIERSEIREAVQSVVDELKDKGKKETIRRANRFEWLMNNSGVRIVENPNEVKSKATEKPLNIITQDFNQDMSITTLKFPKGFLDNSTFEIAGSLKAQLVAIIERIGSR